MVLKLDIFKQLLNGVKFDLNKLCLVHDCTSLSVC